MASRKTSRSEELFERSRRVAPGGVHSPVRAFKGVGGTPVFVESARGAILRDVDGNEYVDFCMSWGPMLFGHADEEIAAAVREAMGRGWSYGTAEPYSLELAEFITSRIPWVEKVRFVNSGTEAVMSAVRVARAATGRDKIIKFDGCYHGHSDYLLVRAGSGLAEMASPDSAGVPKGSASDTIVVDLDDHPALEAAFDRHGDEIAALIIEPLPANNGLLLQRPEFLSKVAELVRRNGALLIFDEVISGFRVAFGGMAEKTSIRPDLVTYGKVIGGGFPVGAYGGRADLMDLVAPAGAVYQAGTLSANPVAMSAGLAMLRKLDRTRPFDELEKLGESLASSVEGLGAEFSNVPLRVQRFGSLFWPVFGGTAEDVRSPVRRAGEIPGVQKERFAKVFHGLLDRGFYLAPSGYEVGFLSTVHTREHAEGLVAAMREVLKTL